MLRVRYKKCATAQLLKRTVVCHLLKIPTRTNVCRSISDSDVNPSQNVDTRHFKLPTNDLGPPWQGLYNQGFQIEIKEETIKRPIKQAEQYFLAIKVARCGKVLELVTFPCLGLGLGW